MTTSHVIVGQTLLHAMSQHDISTARRLFLDHVTYSEDVDDMCATRESVFRHIFHPSARALSQRGYTVQQAWPSDAAYFDVAGVVLSKNAVDAMAQIAHALRSVAQGGLLFCAADNKAGGARLKKMLAQFGIEPLEVVSKNKCRVAIARVGAYDVAATDTAIIAGEMRQVLDGRFWSQAGVFGWDKIDKGSEILTRYIPRDLKGRVADFGCGYGYLSDHILRHCPKVKHITCADADHRAVTLCQKNLAQFDRDTSCVWTDLTQAQGDLRNLEAVIMNPPFHDGKMTDSAIGVAFIKTAYAALRRNGRLWMVANAHLPYEDILTTTFHSVVKHHEGQGFKVYEAVK